MQIFNGWKWSYLRNYKHANYYNLDVSRVKRSLHDKKIKTEKS